MTLPKEKWSKPKDWEDPPDGAFTSVCIDCGGKLEHPVPHKADYHQLCRSCLALQCLREAYRPASREESDFSIKLWGPTGGVALRRRQP